MISGISENQMDYQNLSKLNLAQKIMNRLESYGTNLMLTIPIEPG